MKKAIILALLIAIVPFVVAEDHDATLSVDTQVSVDAESENESSKIKSESQIKISTNEEREARKEKQEEMQRNRDLKLGKQIQGVVKDARAEIKTERKVLSAELKEQVKTCKDKNTQDCKEVRAEAKLAMKDLLISASEKTDAMIESIKQLVANSQTSNKAEVTAKLEARTAALAEAKADAESLDENSTKEKVNGASIKMRTEVEAAKHAIKEETSKIMSERLTDVLQKSQQLERKLSDIVARLQAKGVDTSTIDTASLKAKLTAAAEAKAQADVKVEAAAQLEGKEKGQALNEAANKLRESHKLVKEAHAMLKTMVSEIKAKQGGSAAVEANAETE